MNFTTPFIFSIWNFPYKNVNLTHWKYFEPSPLSIWNIILYTWTICNVLVPVNGNGSQKKISCRPLPNCGYFTAGNQSHSFMSQEKLYAKSLDKKSDYSRFFLSLYHSHNQKLSHFTGFFSVKINITQPISTETWWDSVHKQPLTHWNFKSHVRLLWHK